jgi:hypothetical protein
MYGWFEAVDTACCVYQCVCVWMHSVVSNHKDEGKAQGAHQTRKLQQQQQQ